MLIGFRFLRIPAIDRGLGKTMLSMNAYGKFHAPSECGPTMRRPYAVYRYGCDPANPPCFTDGLLIACGRDDLVITAPFSLQYSSMTAKTVKSVCLYYGVGCGNVMERHI
jgi:hypothetical protein